MIPPPNENNPVIEIIRKIQLLLPNKNDNLAERVVAIQELVAFLKSIVMSQVTTEVFFYFLEHGAATAWILQVDLTQPEASVYRALKTLQKMDAIIPVTKLYRLKTKGGPRPTVWMLPETDVDDVASAIRKHHRARSPKYRVAEEMVQSVIMPYIMSRNNDEGITMSKIRNLLSNQELPYMRVDIENFSANILKEYGIKVWR